jgi:hypothetical protein
VENFGLALSPMQVQDLLVPTRKFASLVGDVARDRMVAAVDAHTFLLYCKAATSSADLKDPSAEESLCLIWRTVLLLFARL